VRGLAGSGKTTLLQWIAVRSATNSFPSELASWNDSVPFYVRLRQHVEQKLPGPEDFANFVAPLISSTAPKNWAYSHLKAGRGIVLVDGLDEVPSAMRTSVRDWLRDLTETFPSCRYVITSRPSAIDEGWLSNDQYLDAELQPMEVPAMFAFIDHWHNAAIEDTIDEDEKIELNGLRDHLKQEVRNTRALRALMETPLICAMLCALHRDRKQTLPADRLELYRACTEAFVERRDLERGIRLQEYPNLIYRQKVILLQDIAYWLLRNGWTLADKSKVVEHIEKTLGTIQGIAQDANGLRVLALLIDRSGLLREPIKDSIDFVHRTFQEYFAAQAILDAGDIGVLRDKAHDDRWREVIVLAAGLARPKEGTSLVAELLKRGDDEPSHRHQMHLLAVACLETSVQIDSSVVEHVTERLAALVPPRNMADAKTLASAGELAVPYLRKPHWLGAQPAAACVRALRLIGTDSALDALEDYASDVRQTVKQEILKAWANFDQPTFASRILSKSSSRNVSLKLGWATSIEGIENLRSARSLQIEDLQGVTDLDAIGRMPTLVHLSLGGAVLVSDLTPLSNLHGLESLRVSGAVKVHSFEFMSGLTGLVSIALSDFDLFGSCRGFASLPKLKEAFIYAWEKLENLDGIQAWSELAELTVYRFHALTTASAIASLKHLERLRFWDCPNLKDIGWIVTTQSNIKDFGMDMSHFQQVADRPPAGQVEQLSVSEATELSDLTAFRNWRHLLELSVSSCYSLVGLRGIQELPELVEITLTGCQRLRDISALAEHSSLKKVHLRGLHERQIKVPEGWSFQFHESGHAFGYRADMQK
jgi:hypothetical protein